MKRNGMAAAAIALSVIIGLPAAEAQGRGGGRGPQAGGRIGGGFGGGFGGGMRAAPSFGGAMRTGPSIGGLGGMRSAPSGFSFGGLRAAPSFRAPSSAGGIRSAPSLGNLRPSLGSSGLRIPSSPGGTRIAPSVVRPNTGALGGTLNIPNVTAPRGLGSQFGSGQLGRGPLGNAPSSSSQAILPRQGAGGTISGNLPGSLRPNLGAPGARPAQPAATPDRRPSLGNLGSAVGRLNQPGGQTTLRPNLGAGGSVGGVAGRSAAPAGGPGLRVPFVGRVTPQQLNDFLALRGGRQFTGGQQFAGGRQWAAGSARFPAGVSNTNSNRFNNLNLTQINQINTNINTGFRRFGPVPVNRGYGFTRFGFGFGSPYWNNWAIGVRSFWNPLGYYGLFTPRFWAVNYCHFPWPRMYYWWGGYPASYWWTCPTWGSLINWFPNYGWSTPYYYGYGPGGNVIINSGYVYVDDVPVATTADYAASAAALAEVPPPANPEQPAEWLPLGTFALSESETDTNPSRVVQLAVDKDGIVSGTMFNKETNQTYPIQGRVDKETQRVAFTIGEARDVVFETGIYNLTQQQTPVLALGDGQEETYLLVRLEQPAAGETPAAGAAPPAAAPASPTPPLPPAPAQP